jgi:hypothetical protein
MTALCISKGIEIPFSVAEMTEREGVVYLFIYLFWTLETSASFLVDGAKPDSLSLNFNENMKKLSIALGLLTKSLS